VEIGSSGNNNALLTRSQVEIDCAIFRKKAQFVDFSKKKHHLSELIEVKKSTAIGNCFKKSRSAGPLSKASQTRLNQNGGFAFLAWSWLLCFALPDRLPA
jgi:hypothetical protein